MHSFVYGSQLIYVYHDTDKYEIEYCLGNANADDFYNSRRLKQEYQKINKIIRLLGGYSSQNKEEKVVIIIGEIKGKMFYKKNKEIIFEKEKSIETIKNKLEIKKLIESSDKVKLYTISLKQIPFQVTHQNIIDDNQNLWLFPHGEVQFNAFYQKGRKKYYGIYDDKNKAQADLIKIKEMNIDGEPISIDNTFKNIYLAYFKKQFSIWDEVLFMLLK